MLFQLRKAFLRDINEQISIPKLVSKFIKSIPEANIELIDYDYVGNATEQDFISFAVQLYDILSQSNYLILITYTLPQQNKKLLRKMYRYEFASAPFSNDVITKCKVVKDKDRVYEDLIFFTNIQKIRTFNDFKIVIEMLFSGVFETKYFLIDAQYEISENILDSWLDKSLWLELDRHGYPCDITVSLEDLYRCKGDCKILYPYGGTDFGSFMMFEF